MGAGGERPDSHPLLVAWPSAPRAGGQALSSDPRYALSDIYDAEHQFLAAQHNLLETAVDKRLRNLIEDHVRETEGQIRNLEHGWRNRPPTGVKGLTPTNPWVGGQR